MMILSLSADHPHFLSPRVALTYCQTHYSGTYQGEKLISLYTNKLHKKDDDGASINANNEGEYCRLSTYFGSQQRL